MEKRKKAGEGRRVRGEREERENGEEGAEKKKLWGWGMGQKAGCLQFDLVLWARERKRVGREDEERHSRGRAGGERRGKDGIFQEEDPAQEEKRERKT